MTDPGDQKIGTLMDEYTSMLVHDLRIPLANILTSLEMLETFPTVQTSPDIQEVIQIARHSAVQLSNDLSSLLDSHRIQSGDGLVTTSPSDIRALIEDAVSFVQYAARSRRQTVQVECGSLPALMVDRDMIRRVFVNILDNAVKYSDAGTTIGISAESTDQNLTISISNQRAADTAENGMEKNGDNPAQMYDPIKRGYGMGLTFCELAVKAHGGELLILENNSGGRTITVTLPCNTNVNLTGTINHEV